MSSPLTPISTLIQGDCRKVMRKLDDASVDMVFADPPYNLQLRQSLKRPNGSSVQAVTEAWDSFASLKHYDRYCRSWLTEVKRVLKPDGTFWVIGSYHNIYRLGSLLQSMGFWILNDIVWVKTNPMPNFRGRRFTNAHETLLWCAPSQKARYRFNYRSLKTGNDDRQVRSDWVIPICSGHERIRMSDGQRAHPTQKPLALLRRILLSSTTVGDTILDPFLGSGTTAVAARELRRHCVGIEQESDYLDVARQRLANTEPLDQHSLTVCQEPRSRPRIPFSALVDAGMVTPGTKLYSRCAKHEARVLADGSLRMNDQIGSIHSVAAHASGRESCNGWTYWIASSGRNTTDTAPLDTLRDQWQQQSST